MSQYDSPEAAYFAFLETFNARDADGWADVNVWPHARISAADPATHLHWRPQTRVFTDRDEYLSQPLWDDLEGTGWARSESTPPKIVQSSDLKAHIAGGWTRYDRNDRAMASNRIVYVMTKTAVGWGMQAQLKTDSFVEGTDYAAQRAAALEAVELALRQLSAGNIDRYAEMLSYPFTLVGPPGVIIQIDSAVEMSSAMRAVGDDQLTVSPGSAAIVNCGASGANLTFRVQRNGVDEEALALVGLRDGVWRMLAISGI